MILFDLIHYYICQDHNPNANTHAAAQKTPFTTWKFCQKTQIWKPLFRAIQGIILIPLACWRFTGHIPIKDNHQNSRNRYTEFKIFHEKFIIVLWNLCIFMAFQLLILIPWMILKLTNIFNCIFMHHTRFHHCCFLGLPSFRFRRFYML